MTDRDAHRAAVDAGYASLAEYIKKWGDDKMDILKRLSEYNPPDRVNDEMREIAIDIQDAKNEIERLREALADIANIVNPYEEGDTMQEIARSALQQKESE